MRGFAAIIVMLFHFFGATLPKLKYGFTDNPFSWGWAGVQVFFVISGFVITISLAPKFGKIKELLGFLMARITRILVPAGFSLLLTIFLYITINVFNLSQNNWLQGVSLWTIITNFLLLAPYLDEKWINGVFWTLAIEFQFYFLMVFLAITNFNKIICLAVMLIMFSIGIISPDGKYLPLYSSSFAMGVFCALYFNRQLNFAKLFFS